MIGWLFRRFLARQIRVAVSTGHERGQTSAQPVPGGPVAARRLLKPQLHLQLLRLLRHGVTLSGHAVGTAGKEVEDIKTHEN